MNSNIVADFEFSTNVIITNDSNFRTSASLMTNPVNNEMKTVLPHETQLSDVTDYDMIRWTGSSSDDESDVDDRKNLVHQTLNTKLSRSPLGEVRDLKLQSVCTFGSIDNLGRNYQSENLLKFSCSLDNPAKENQPPVMKTHLRSLLGSPSNRKRKPLFNDSPTHASSSKFSSSPQSAPSSSILFRKKVQYNSKPHYSSILRNATLKIAEPMIPTFESPLKKNTKCSKKPREVDVCLPIQRSRETSSSGAITELLHKVSAHKHPPTNALHRQIISRRPVTPVNNCNTAHTVTPARTEVEQLRSSLLQGQIEIVQYNTPMSKMGTLTCMENGMTRTTEVADAKLIPLFVSQFIAPIPFLLQVLVLIYFISVGFNSTPTSQLEYYADNNNSKSLVPYTPNSFWQDASRGNKELNSNPKNRSVMSRARLVPEASTKTCFYLNRFSGINGNICVAPKTQLCPCDNFGIQSRFILRVSIISVLLKKSTAVEVAQPRFD